MLQRLLATGAVATLSTALIVLAKRWRQRRMMDQLPLHHLGPNELGVSAAISPVGASIVKLVVPAADGSQVDVVLGFAKASSYVVCRVCAMAIHLKGLPHSCMCSCLTVSSCWRWPQTPCGRTLAQDLLISFCTTACMHLLHAPAAAPRWLLPLDPLKPHACLIAQAV